MASLDGDSSLCWVSDCIGRSSIGFCGTDEVSGERFDLGGDLEIQGTRRSRITLFRFFFHWCFT